MVNSTDPNDIVGPASYGPQNFITASATDAYTIDFENAATATAPAQDITITQQLDPNLDWRSFRLTGFGFDQQTTTLPGTSPVYSGLIDDSATKGYDVEVTAGVDVSTGLVTWTFQTIDPKTGQTPTDPTLGLLPIDDAAGDGEGFVSYTIKPKSTDQTGTIINAQAQVIFDTNAPIDTPAISNTIDAVAPTSQVQALPAETNDTTFEVSWSGQDDAQGSGLASYTIMVSEDGATPTLWLVNTTRTNALFTGVLGHIYAFSSVATDNAGNVEAPHAMPDATIQVGTPAPTGLSLDAATDSGTLGDALTNSANIKIDGTALANSIVKLYDGSTLVGTAAADASGAFSITTSALADGSHNLTATATDAIGSVSAASAAYSVTVDTIKPSVASVTTSGPGITNGSGDLGIGSTITFALNTSNPVYVDTSGGTPTIALSDGGTATYVSGSGTTSLIFTSVVTAGENSPDLAVAGASLNGGTIEDAAGNKADLTGAITNPAGTLQIDTLPPAPTLALSSLGAGDTPNVSGTALDGATLILYDGTSNIGTTTADASTGAYSITGTGLGAGEHILTAKAIDGVGQVSAASSPLTVEVGTAATIVGELDALETKPNLSAIVITDPRLLPVASVAVMNHLMTADAAALAAIQGGYSFGITTVTSTGTVTSIYNPAGVLTFTSTTQPGGSTTFDSFDASGTLTREDVTAADKSQVITKYGITGQSYTTEQDSYNSAGVLTSQIRTHADGTSASSYVLNPDGSTVLESFDALGTLTRKGTTYADKSQDITKYGITGQSYTTEHDTYNSAGVLTSQVRTHADGTSASSYVLNPDGSSVLDSFNAAGILTREGKTYADKSQDITKYSGTSPNIVTEHDVINAQGTQSLVDQTQTNGSHVEFIYGSNQTLTSNTGISDAFDDFSAGSTTFVFNPSFGQDTIANFHTGAGANHDVIQIGSATLNQFSDLVGLMSPSGANGADTLITVDPTDTILLKHVAKTTLTAQNFAFTHVA